MRLVLHIGLPKTGSKAVQKRLAPQLAAVGWHTEVDPMVGWDAARVHPEGLRIVPQWNLGRWDAALARCTTDSFISQENICMATAATIVGIARETRRFDVEVVITAVELPLAMARWWQEMQLVGNQLGLAEFVDSFDWRSTSPDYDGRVLRPDAVAELWSEHFEVTVIHSASDVVSAVAAHCGLMVPTDDGTEHASPRRRRIVDTRWWDEADHAIRQAIKAGTTADLREIEGEPGTVTADAGVEGS